MGIGSLDTAGVGGDPAVMKLDLLYVSAGYRGPSQNTVNAYLRMGAKVLDSPDPAMFAREPDDIHLVLNVADVASRRPPRCARQKKCS